MKPTTVHIRKTRHKDQPWTVTIQPPGKAEAYKIQQRYARPFTAKRGALRHLDAISMQLHKVRKVKGRWRVIRGGCKFVTPKGSAIVFK
jgi:hypothetical protein